MEPMPPLRVLDTAQGPIRYAQAGEGTDVVLLHGAMTSVEDMLLGPFDPLADRYRVTAFDRPGHGATPRRRGAGAPSNQARHVLAAIEALDLGPAAMLGQSFGAALAMELALFAPGRVRGVVAVSPVVFPEVRMEHLLYGPRALPGVGDAIAYGPGRLIDALLLPVLWEAMFAPQPMPERYRELYPFALASGPDQLRALGEEAVLALPDLACAAWLYPRCEPPVAVLSGSADWLSPPWRHAARLAALAPRAKLSLLPGLGHMLHHFAIGEVVEAVEAVTG
jgi:pimeloyl-ACP methyl ester carboxylesterase